MPNFLKGSILVSALGSFVNAYNNSRVKGCINTLILWWRASVFRAILSAYSHKKPWYRYSLTHRFILFLASIIDKIFDTLYKIFNRLSKGSILLLDDKKIRELSLSDKCCLVGALFLSIPVGAILGGIVRGSCTQLDIVISWVIFIMGIVIVILGTYGKNSLFIKLIKGIINALR